MHGRAHWCHLANTVQRLCMAAVSGSADSGGDAACSQIILFSFKKTIKINKTVLEITVICMNY